MFDELTICNINIRTIQSKTFKKVLLGRITIEDKAVNINDIHFDAFGTIIPLVKLIQKTHLYC